jgi:hypothetical protein
MKPFKTLSALLVVLALAAVLVAPTAVAKKKGGACGQAIATLTQATKAIKFSGGNLIETVREGRAIAAEIYDLQQNYSAAQSDGERAAIQAQLTAAYARRDANLAEARLNRSEWAKDVRHYSKQIRGLTNRVADDKLGCSNGQVDAFADRAGAYFDEVARVGRVLAKLGQSTPV